MNVLLLLLLTVISNSDSYLIDTKDSKTEESVLLQKLHHLQKRSEPDIVQIPTWSEMLADVIVNRIKIFSFHKSDEQNAASTDVGTSETIVHPGIITRIVSTILNNFKIYIYDPWYHHYNYSEVNNLHANEIVDDANEVVEEPNEIVDPNEDVEIIEPKYHGKLCDNCTESQLVKCPDGLEINDKGDCVDTKASKFILSVPYHCPIGYRRDMYGFCRLTI